MSNCSHCYLLGGNTVTVLERDYSMVRSKSEGGRAGARNLFYLVDRLRAEEKYFDVSRDAIERDLRASGYCEISCEHTVEDDGGILDVVLRLNLSCRASLPQCWSAALKLHATRIDGIDHEARFTSSDGTVGHGWHRHGWDNSKCNAEHIKHHLDGFDKGLSNRSKFLIKTCQEMRIRLNRKDHDQGDLQGF